MFHVCFAVSGTVISLPHCNGIDSVMVSVLASSAVDRGFQSGSGQTKGYTIGMFCLSAKY